MAAKLDIFRVMNALDRRDKTFYDNLTDEERKAFSPYVMLRWASTVEGNTILEQWYVEETNRMVNIDYFTLAKHPKLMWLLYSQVGSTRKVKHNYLAKSQKKKDKTVEALMTLYPTMKAEDLALLAKLAPEQVSSIENEYQEFKSDFE